MGLNYSVVRYDLIRCYSYNEYKKAIAYAKENINIAGMQEQIEKLNKEMQKYNQDIENIVKPEKELENKKYLEWEKWSRINGLCTKIMIGVGAGTILCWILGMVLSGIFLFLGILGFFLSIIMFFVLMASKVIVSIYAGNYNKYIKKVKDKIMARNAIFEVDAHQYYEEIDSLYLCSLDPAHREAVRMRREQAEHNELMRHLEEERNKREKERLQEEKKVRRVQERLLEIEEEREKRRRGY